MENAVDIQFICKPGFEVDIKTSDGLNTACHGVVSNMLTSLNLQDNVLSEETRDEAYGKERQNNVIVG